MIKPLFSFIVLFTLLSCGNSIKEKEDSEGKVEIVDLSQVTNEKKEIVSEIISFQKDIENRKLDKIPDYFDCPKRVEEIELSMNNSKIRNAIELNSSRLSTDVVKEQFDLLYTEMDLDIINESLKLIPENDFLTQDEVKSTVNIGECDYDTRVTMNGKEVKFSIVTVTENENCKKDQQWKFNSNGEYLVLDRRYYL